MASSRDLHRLGVGTEPQFALERLIMEAWNRFASNSDGDLKDLAIPEPLKEEFQQIRGQVRSEDPLTPDELRLEGRTILRGKILKARALLLTIPKQERIPDLSGIGKKTARKLFERIIDRIESETTFIDDAITDGAIKFSRHGLFSKQLKALIVPIHNKFLQNFIRQPIFLPDVGVVLFPGGTPAPIEVVQSLAKDGKFPASFSKLQESVADILSWPLYKRVGSFLLSAGSGLVTAPLRVFWKLAVTLPRLFGIAILKRSKLPLFVDPTLDAAFVALSEANNGDPALESGADRKRYQTIVDQRCPRESADHRRAAVESLLLLRAFGFGAERIGSAINGARYDERRGIFPKLERLILKECRKFGIRTAEDRKHLLALDDSVWTLATLTSRLQVMRIAREEILAALDSSN